MITVDGTAAQLKERVVLLCAAHLVLPVILLGMAKDSVAKPADMSEWCVALIAKLLQSQHGTIPAVCERGLEKFENL